jgi:O-antigen ligase
MQLEKELQDVTVFMYISYFGDIDLEGYPNIKNLDNPHNQFLLTFFEMGIIGIFFLMYMFYSHWESLKRVNLGKEDYLKDMMEGLILIMLIGSLFNSMLIDAGEGRFYCIMAGLFLSAYTPKKLIKKSA